MYIYRGSGKGACPYLGLGYAAHALPLSGPAGGGEGGVPALISTFENFLVIFKQYQRNFATLTKIYWRTRFRKKILSRA